MCLSHAKDIVGDNFPHVVKSILILLAGVGTSVVKKEKVSCQLHSKGK